MDRYTWDGPIWVLAIGMERWYTSSIVFPSTSFSFVILGRESIKMARATKILTLINEEIVIGDVDEINGAASIQYGVGGSGTLVLEITAGDNAAGVDEWVGVAMWNPSFAVNAYVANLAAAGYAWAEIVGAKKVRIRKSVAGAGPVRATLTVNNG